MGVSGVGKSSIIKELFAIDSRFIYITPFTTRPSRGTEETKVSISDQEMNDLWNRGELLSINEIHGIRCGTSRSSITRVLEQNNIPVLDWPLSYLEVIKIAFPFQLYIVYVLPPSNEILQQRLMKEARHLDGNRLQNAYKELEVYKSLPQKICDLEIVSEENQTAKIAQMIYAGYLSSS